MPPLEAQSAAAKSTVIALRGRQRESWERGKRMLVEELTREAVTQDLSDDDWLELILGEFDLRLEFGEQPAAAEYLSRFPKFADRIERLLTLHLAMGGSEDSQDDLEFGDGTSDATSGEPQAESPSLVLQTLSLDEFVQRIGQSGVLTQAEVAGIIQQQPESERPKSAVQLAKALVRHGKMTRYQVEQILAGRGESLVLNDYLILDRLGQGGMGQVFQAQHRRMKRRVALKMIREVASRNPDSVKRFHREVEAAAKLIHPNIITAYDAAEVKGTHFLVMELVEGIDLSQRVKLHGPLPLGLAVECITQAARGLEYAHQHGVIHRDIKPANLLLSRETRAESRERTAVADSQLSSLDSRPCIKILDMGLARLDQSEQEGQATELTGSGSIMGTVDFMSPEQAVNTKFADARSDIYSLGMSLFQLLTGRPAYQGETVMEKLLAHREAPIPELSRELRVERREGDSASDSDTLDAQLASLDSLFRRMVAKKPADRFQSMTEVIAALETFRAAHPDLADTSKIAAHGSTSRLDATGTSNPRLAETYITSSHDSHTDPQTEHSLTSPLVAETVTMSTLARPSNRRRLLTASLLVGGVLVLLGIIIKIKHKDGSETIVKVPDGAKVEITSEGASVEGQPNDSPKTTATVPVEFDPEPLPGLVAQPSRLKNVKHWQLETRDPRGGVTQAAFHPDGSVLAVGSWDGMVRILDAESWELRAVYPGHSEKISALAWSPDGRQLATAGGDRTVRLLNHAEDRRGAVLGTCNEIPFSLAWSPSGKWLAATDGFIVRLWPTNGGPEVKVNPLCRSYIMSVTWVSDTLLAVAGGGLKLLTIEGEPGPKLDEPTEDTSSVLASPDGKWLAVGDLVKRKVGLWDCQTWKQVRELAVNAAPNTMDWSGDSRFLWVGDNDGAIHAFDLMSESAEPIVVARAERMVTSLDISRHPRTGGVCTVDATGMLRSVSADGRQIQERKSSKQGIYYFGNLRLCLFSPEGDRWLDSRQPGLVAVRDGEGRLRGRWPVSRSSVSSFIKAWKPDGTGFGAIQALTNTVWQPHTEQAGAVSPSWPFAHDIICLSWSPDGHRAAVSLDSGTVAICSLEGKVLKEIKGAVRPSALSWSPDSRRLVASEMYSFPKIIDTDEGTLGVELTTPSQGPSALSWSPAGDHIAVGTRYGQVWLFQPDGKLVTKFDAHGSIVTTIVWRQDGQQFLTGGHDGTWRLWGLDGQRLSGSQGAFTGPISDLSWDREKREVRTLCADGVLRVWDETTGALQRFFLPRDNEPSFRFDPQGHLTAGDPAAAERELIYLIKHNDGHTTVLTPNEFRKLR